MPRWCVLFHTASLGMPWHCTWQHPQRSGRQPEDIADASICCKCSYCCMCLCMHLCCRASDGCNLCSSMLQSARLRCSVRLLLRGCQRCILHVLVFVLASQHRSSTLCCLAARTWPGAAPTACCVGAVGPWYCIHCCQEQPMVVPRLGLEAACVRISAALPF